MDRLAAARAMTCALRRRIALRVFGANFAPAAALALFAGGAAVLAGRLWAPGWRVHILIWTPTVLAAAAFAFAAFRAWRRTPSFEKLLTYIDSISPGGGLLGCASERGAEAWLDSITLPFPPAVSARRTAVPVAALLAGMAFLTGAALVPVDRSVVSAPKVLDISREKELISEKIELLESEEVLPPGKAERMRDELERLASENRAEDASAVYEQLDTMERQLADTAAEAARNMNSALNSAEAGGGLAEAALKIPDGMKNAAVEKELAELAGKFGGVNPELAEKLAASCKNGKIDAETLKKLAAACKGKSGKLGGKLKKLSDAGLCSGNCSGDANAALMKFLAESGCTEDLKCMLAENCDGNVYSTGWGQSRGRGDAGLSLSNNASAAGTFGKDISLAASEGASLTVSQSAAAPEEGVEKERKDAVAGSLQAGVSGREKRGASVNPAHRRAVDRYMNKISDKEK